MTKKNGFTLVELIVVILILGIMSSYSASRYLGKSSFSAYTYQEAAVSVIRQVQVNRMQSNLHDESGDLTPFILSVKDQCLGSLYSCVQNDPNITQRSDLIVIDSGSFSAREMCPTNSAVDSVSFDLLGNPALDTNQPDPKVQITIDDGEVVAFLCINSQGYVSKGECLC
ncbi:MSHA pilin protein MshC [Vibrio astriarenae]|nr:MSHA pilin protein MshC [Vibrio sp. C7]